MRKLGSSILLGAGALLSALGLLTCGPGGGSASTTGACPQDVCGGDGGAGTGGTAAGAAGTSTAGKGGAAGTDTGPCTEAWLCTPWDTGGNGDSATRTCTDQNKCGTTANKPTESATLPALDMNFFRCNVEPVLDLKCSMMGCHGTETGRALRVYARARLRHAGETLTDPALCASSASSDSCTASDSCPCTAKHTDVEWQKNFDAARGFLLDPAGKPIPAGMEDTSDFIAQPVVGGKAHAGVHLFKTGDADYMALHQWLTGAKLASCDPGFN